MMDDQEDIDSAAEHQQELEEQRRLRESDPTLAFWIKYHDETVARQRTERAELAKIRYALDRLFA